jgi:orotate phosphoribosyltransferase
MATNRKEETYFIYDRKDQKLHGEKGDIVGTFKSGNTIIVDDVITAGTAIKNTLNKLEKHNLKITSLLVLLDRQEKGSENISASEEIKKKFDIDVYSLISISDIIDYVSSSQEFEEFKNSIIEYKEKYGS